MSSEAFWDCLLGNQDSNLDSQSQSLESYRWTIPHYLGLLLFSGASLTTTARRGHYIDANFVVRFVDVQTFPGTFS